MASTRRRMVNQDHSLPLLHLSDHTGREDEETHPNQPPLPIKVTLYRVISSVTVIILGTFKTRQALANDGNVSATWLDFAVGTVAATIFYWAGLYADIEPPVCEWLFHCDYSRELRYFIIVAIITAALQVILPLFTIACITLLWVFTRIAGSKLALWLVSMLMASSIGRAILPVLILLLGGTILSVGANLAWLSLRAILYLLKFLWRPIAVTRFGIYLQRTISMKLVEDYMALMPSSLSYIFYFAIPMSIGITLSVTILHHWVYPIIWVGGKLFPESVS